MSKLSFDDQAAHAAEMMFAKSDGAGGMPETRAGSEGGFAPQAGGKALEDGAAKSGTVAKAGKTGSAITAEPGRQGGEPATGEGITNEPKEEEASAAPGTPSGLETAADEDPQHRARKPGQVGIPGGGGDGAPGTGDGSNLDQSADDQLRARKPGQVGVGGGTDMSKAGPEVSADDLIKSLETLESIAAGSTVTAPAERREALAAKLAEGTLSKSEMAELASMVKAGLDSDPLSKSGAAEEPVRKSFQDAFAEDPQMQQGYDVSPFLERQNQLLAAGLDEVETRLAKSLDGIRDRGQAFNTQLAKSLIGMAKLSRVQNDLIKSLTERLSVVEKTPLTRKGAVTAKDVLHKGMENEAGAGSGGELSRTQIMDTLEEMAKSMPALPGSGMGIAEAMSLVEQTGQVSRRVLEDVQAFRQKNGARA